LATTPTPRDQYNATSPFKQFYLPASVNPVRYDSDNIFAGLNNSSTSVYQYKISNNTWYSPGSQQAFTTPYAYGGMSMVFDDRNWIFWECFANNYPMYKMDMSLSSPSWVNFHPNESFTIYALAHFWTMPGRIRANNALGCTYWFFGDKDSIKVATKIPTATPRYYWAYAGRYDPLYRPQVMTLASPVSAGSAVSMTVDTATGYAVGDYVVLYDPATNLGERAVLQAVGSTTITATIANSYTAGTRIGVDPYKVIITGDTGFAVALGGAQGLKKDMERDYYHVMPTLAGTPFVTSYVNGRGYSMGTPFMILHPSTALTRCEGIGFLKDVFSVIRGSYPNPQSEDIMYINGKRYLTFMPQEGYTQSGSDRMIVIGSLD
jgi:hypothetical protein